MIGQKFVATVAQGKIPEGGRMLRTFPESASQELDQARLGFDSVRLLDNSPQDSDPRQGHVSIDYGNSGDGGYRAHRYEANIEGSAEQGTVSERRHFPAMNLAEAMTDASWTKLDGRTLTSVAYLQLDGRDKVDYASLNHVDIDHPENGRAFGWTTGFDTAALEQAQDWQLLQ